MLTIRQHTNRYCKFSFVGRLMGMDVATTLKTWTVMETAIAVVGFAIAWAVFGVAGLVS